MPAPRLADPFYSVVDPSPFYRRRGKGYFVCGQFCSTKLVTIPRLTFLLVWIPVRSDRSQQCRSSLFRNSAPGLLKFHVELQLSSAWDHGIQEPLTVHRLSINTFEVPCPVNVANGTFLC